MSGAVTEVTKDTFWTLIDQAKEHTGGPSEWLMEQLVGLGLEQAKRFDTMARVYMDLDALRAVLREEWGGGSLTTEKCVQAQEAGDVGDDVLGFLLALQGNDETALVNGNTVQL